MSHSVFYPQGRAILQIIFDGFGTDDQDTEPVVIPILLRSASIHLNSYKQADSFEVTFEAGDLPIDPTLIRSGSIEIYIFQTAGIPPEDQQQVDRQFTDLDPALSQRPRTVLDTIAQDIGLAASRDKFTFDNKPRIVGLFDQHDLDMDSSGKFVTITGQDYTQLLIAKQWPPTSRGRARRIPTGLKLDAWMNKILREADPVGNLKLKLEDVSTSELPTVGRGETRCHKRGIPVKQNTSYFDVLYKVATRYGFITFIRGLDLVLTKPKNLRDRASTNIKRVAWGKNLLSLRLTRHLGKEKVPRVVLRSYDPKSRETLSIEFPQRGQDGPVGTLGVTEDEFQIFTVNGISDPKVLRETAKTLFELLGRGERQITAVTRDLRDLDGNPMLNIEAGDAVEIDFQDFNRELVSDPRVSEDQKFSHLITRGFNSVIARTIARQYQKLLTTVRPMRFREGTIEYDVSNGIEIEMQLQDFVVIDGMRTVANKTPTKIKRKDRIRDNQGVPINASLARLL